MSIDSKRFKIKSTGTGGYLVRCKSTNRSAYVPNNGDVPSHSRLAAMSENAFDKSMEGLLATY